MVYAMLLESFLIFFAKWIEENSYLGLHFVDLFQKILPQLHQMLHKFLMELIIMKLKVKYLFGGMLAVNGFDLFEKLLKRDYAVALMVCLFADRTGERVCLATFLNTNLGKLFIMVIFPANRIVYVIDHLLHIHYYSKNQKSKIPSQIMSAFPVFFYCSVQLISLYILINYFRSLLNSLSKWLVNVCGLANTLTYRMWYAKYNRLSPY